MVGPLPITPGGNRYIITLMDYFSKWPEAEPVKDKRTDTVASFLYRFPGLSMSCIVKLTCMYVCTYVCLY